MSFYFLFILFSMFGAEFSHAQMPNLIVPKKVSNNSQVLRLNETSKKYTFSNNMYYMEDKTNLLTIDDVTDHQVRNKFQLLTQDNISLGYIESTIWLKFTLVSSNNIDWRLLFDYPLLDEIVIYSDGENNQWQTFTMGDLLLFDKRPITHRYFVKNLIIEPNVQQHYFVKIKTTSSMQIRPSIVSAEKFFIEELANEMFFGLVYGIMLLMAIYNIFLYIAVKDITYLAYVFSVLSGCIFIMTLNGHAYQYLWPQSIEMANTAVPLTPSVWMIFTAVFTQMFLETKKFAPRLYYAMNIQIGLALISVFISLFGPYQFAIKVATGLALINGLLILTTSIICLINGNRFARYFVIAWVVYGVGTGMLIISRFGVLPDNFITHNSAALGLLVEIIMLSLALSDKYRVMTKQLEIHTNELEEKVVLRTKELETSNRKLEALTRIDDLTGLANRRYLDHQLNAEWAIAKRSNSPISMLVVDIDQFKSINDYFGHQYGDKAIISVAAILKKLVTRPSDLPARFGGDEFVIILPNTDNSGAIALAKQICSSIEKLQIKQADDSIYPYVTISLGCATLIPNEDNTLQNLFSLADEKLYLAKEQGRNCVAY